MAHSLATKAVSWARVKNDAVDAKTLAHLLRTNLLPDSRGLNCAGDRGRPRLPARFAAP
jgi:hypothetical protein